MNEYLGADDLHDFQPTRKAKSSTPKHYMEVAGATTNRLTYWAADQKS